MERICKHCLWWEENTGKYDHKECGRCTDSHFIYTGMGENVPVNGLGYWDYESYSAGFETGSQFGCIHFMLTNAPEKVSETDKNDPDDLEIF